MSCWGTGCAARGQITGALTLHVSFADASSVVRARQLPEPSGHTHDLRGQAYRIFDALGLQRARVRGITVTAGCLAPAGSAGGQVSLDRVRESRLRAEPVIEAVNAKFGRGAVGPATLASQKAG